ncbi:hypothetical protein BGZ65_008902 [Modicella reniformis]|uniref:Uncharacterized protein n=1 Tax=Modicella reniformis TaxID=1440133 RepID=A0A9P6MLZ8_9FUNG|nr:hypothetical protein BGZ65_008902 [Modicella reniformis]
MDCNGKTGSMDPETGSMYIPHVQEGIMARVSLTTKTYDRVAMPPNIHIEESHLHNFAWSTAQRQLIMIEATEGPLGQVKPFNAYSYSVEHGWKNISKRMKGQVPRSRRNSCFVPAYGGSKMILFGGDTIGSLATLSDIYVLDIATLTWTRGTNVAKKGQRGDAACAVSNDQFISWGGLNMDTGKIASSTVVYNIKTNRWTKAYIAAPHTPTGTRHGTPEPRNYYVASFPTSSSTPSTLQKAYQSTPQGSPLL